jgi:hypothetical protein
VVFTTAQGGLCLLLYVWRRRSITGSLGGNMETMTEEEAFALDEYYTKNPPKVDPSKARIRVVKVSPEKPEEILSDLVREKLAVSV